MRYLLAFLALIAAPAYADPVDRAAVIAAVQNLPQVTAPPVSTSAGYKISRVDYPSGYVGISRQVIITGGGPCTVLVAPSLGSLAVQSPCVYSYTPRAAGLDQVQVRNGTGEVWLLMMSVR